MTLRPRGQQHKPEYFGEDGGCSFEIVKAELPKGFSLLEKLCYGKSSRNVYSSARSECPHAFLNLLGGSMQVPILPLGSHVAERY